MKAAVIVLGALGALGALVALVAGVACHDAPPPAKTGTPDELAAYLDTVAGADEATRKREVASWIVDETTWSRDIVAPYRALYNEYVAGFDAQVPAMVAELAPLGAVTARRHYAGDRRLVPAQIRARWAVPVEFPSMVAELAGKPIATVFIFDGARWRALLGLDQIVMAHVAALDPACANKLALAGPPGRCTEVGWLVVDSALRQQRERFAHACELAATLCGNPVP
ncbi:MAG: hypothetical protein ABI467_02595 [Kofleriaceae bacterium]